ncbi:hypothetical protein C0995_006499 [Termitomyces sp. Mi166|nr:hypothetical protein C0995_006499 [Termitomyces sp. Mi166\
MELKSLFVLVSLTVSSFAQTTSTQVESDITDNIMPLLSTDIAALETFSTSGGTLDQAMAIHTVNTNLNDAVVATTDDINNASCPFPDGDASDILTLLEALGPNIQSALMDFIATKPGFDALGVTSIFSQDLVTLKASSDAMGAALIGCVSVRPSLSLLARKIDVEQSNIAPAAEEFQAGVDAAFAPAIAAFT